MDLATKKRWAALPATFLCFVDGFVLFVPSYDGKIIAMATIPDLAPNYTSCCYIARSFGL
jgi:hypothetical protein